MDNAERLQQSIAQVNEIKEKLQNKSTLVGGLNINGKLLKCKTANEKVSKGDLVSVSYYAYVSSAIKFPTIQNGITMIKPGSSRGLAVYSGDGANNYLYYSCFSIATSGNTIQKGVSDVLISTTNSCMYKPIVIALNPGKAVIFHSYSSNYQLYATVVSINSSNVVTVEKTTQILSETNSFSKCYGNTGFLYDTNKVAVAINFDNNTYCYRFEISEDNTVVQLNTECAITNGKVPISYEKLDSKTGILMLASTTENSAEIQKIDLESDSKNTIISNLPSSSDAFIYCNFCLIDNNFGLYVGYKLEDSQYKNIAYIIDISLGSILSQKIVEEGNKVSSKIQKISENVYAFLSYVDTNILSSNIITIENLKITSIDTVKYSGLSYRFPTTSLEVFDFLFAESNYYGDVFSTLHPTTSIAQMPQLQVYPRVTSPTATTYSRLGGVCNSDADKYEFVEVYVPNV